jgi:hypothetical protein
MDVLGQVRWLDLLFVGLMGLLLGGLFESLRMRKFQQAKIDAVHRRCWSEQDRWLNEHEAKSATVEQERLEALAQAQAAVQERDQARDAHGQAVERVRREMDAARAGYCRAEQALCQQLLSLDRQVAAERTAHRREVQALRMQCDELGEMLASERQAVRVDADQHREICGARDQLRQEVTKLLDLLDESDTAQAALQHRANVLEQQLALGQRQLEEARHALKSERARAPVLRPVAQAAITTIAAAALAPGACVLQPFERQPDSPPPDHLPRVAGVGRRVHRENWVGQARALLDEQRRERRVYPARLPLGAQDRRVSPRQTPALVAA